ncbi:hypothetical protein LINGRAHAP2_LOCUS13395 [Linum grandiflorum]
MDYPYLPEEIQEKIVKEHFPSFRQLVALSGVCKSWRSIAKDHLVNSFPGILVSETSCPREKCFHNDCRCVDCCRTAKLRRCQLRINSTNSRVPVPHHQFRPISTLFNSNNSSCRDMWGGTTRQIRLRESSVPTSMSFVTVDLDKCHCVASKDGWLVLTHSRDFSALGIHLLNPVTGASIPLPRLEPDGYRSRAMYRHVILSSSPEKHDCHLIVLSDIPGTPQVALCKVNGGYWKYTHEHYSRFFDIIECACYFGGKLYVVDRSIADRFSAVDGRKSVHVFDNLINVTEEDSTSPPPPTVRCVKLPYLGAAGPNWTACYYAMELNCQLIIVICHCSKGDVVYFQVYKLVSTKNGKYASNCWKEVRSLDGHAAFLGTHQCFCVPVKDDGTNIKRDHIYYLNNGCGQCALEYAHRNVDYGHGLDCGVFSLEDRKIVEHSRLATNNYQDYIWFLPMPWNIHKHLNKKNKKNKNKQKPRKSKEHHEIDVYEFKKCSLSKVADRNGLLLPFASDPTTPVTIALSLYH